MARSWTLINFLIKIYKLPLTLLFSAYTTFALLLLYATTRYLARISNSHFRRLSKPVIPDLFLTVNNSIVDKDQRTFDIVAHLNLYYHRF